ncbi:MAG TPA: glycoside hydrolase family 18 protein, partial [Flavobacteriales bacterium]|nr:glycoside hydrolase family 18 protein [Flavobacteriales bacterium]
ERTGHHTALYSTASQHLSAESAVHLLDSLHVPRKKIVIGSAFYTRVFKDVGEANNGLYQAGVFSHSFPFAALDTAITATKGWSIHTDREACSSYAYNKERRLFATYDDAMSVAAKAGYVRHEGLGGIMFWQLNDDRPLSGLLNVLANALHVR